MCSRPRKSTKYVSKQNQDLEEYIKVLDYDLDQLYDKFNNLICFKKLRVGSDDDYVEIDGDGEMTFNGDATVWDDLRVPATSARILGAVGVPDFEQFADDGAASTGVYTFMFDDSADEQLFFTAQMPHSYKEGSTIYPHVHWSPQTTDTGTVTWKLEYTVATVNETFGDTSTVTMQDTGDGTVNKHQITASGTISGTGLGISHMLVCRIYRDVSDGDDFSGDAALLEIDFHYEIDTVGSKTESTK